MKNEAVRAAFYGAISFIGAWLSGWFFGYHSALHGSTQAFLFVLAWLTVCMIGLYVAWRQQ